MSWTIESIRTIVEITVSIGGAMWGLYKMWAKKLISKWYEHYKANRDQWRILLMHEMSEIRKEMKDIRYQLYPNGNQSVNDKITVIGKKQDWIVDTLGELKTGQRNTREILDVAVWESDETGRFTYVSSRMCEIFGCAPEDLKDRSWIGLLIHEDRDRVRDLWNRSVQDASFFNEVFTIKKCSDDTLVEVNATAVHNKDEKGNVISSLGKISRTDS